MDKKQFGKPYTFRGRMLAILLICAVTAFLLGLAGSLGIGSVAMSGEVSETEHSIAVYLLELAQKTDLPADEVISMARRKDFSLTRLSEPENHLTPAELTQLRDTAVLTSSVGPSALPVTYVLLDDATIVRIFPGSDFNLLLIVLSRISTGAFLFLLLFAGLSALAAWRMAKPISQLTQATRQIKGGDFTVRLPEGAPGEIGELMQSFNSMTDELSRTAYLQKDFISSISHEFRTPIASIRGFARLLQTPGLPEQDRQEYVGMIAAESDRLSRLSDTLLRLSALTQQTAPAALSSFRLDEQLRQVILQLQPAWTGKDIDWQLELNPVTIASDCDMLAQIWINLIQNAVKFSGEGGVIEVHVYQTDMAEVEVIDHGIGMTEETRARIFDRFYQGDASRSHEGVGLGLCLVKQILDILGGEIRVRSVLGEGSAFRVRLPLSPRRTSA